MTLDPAMLGASIHERKERDFYPTPLEATAPILKWIDASAFGASLTIWECAAGDLAMSRPLIHQGHKVVSSDILPLDVSILEHDFLEAPIFPWFAEGSHGIITNPPYGELAQKFCERALEFIRAGHVRFAAMIMRHEYDCAVGRRHLFDDCPEYAAKITLTFRPRWIAGSEGSPRHNYAWYIWDGHHQGRAEQFYAHREDQAELINGFLSFGL